MTAQIKAPAGTKIVLGSNQYGKAEVHLVKITRDTDRHQIQDLNVTSQLHGDFAAAHTDGDNAHVVATDTQKNTVYGLARDGVASPEEFLVRLGEHFTSKFDWVTGGRWAAQQFFWDRINDHDHAFSQNKSEVRTAVLEIAENGEKCIVAGLEDLTVLKSTGSEFHGFPVDKYTTLKGTTERILATDVTARWRYTPEAVSAGIDFDAVYASVRSLLLTQFALTPMLCSRACTTWVKRFWRHIRKSLKSRCPCQTSITSWWTLMFLGRTTRMKCSLLLIVPMG